MNKRSAVQQLCQELDGIMRRTSLNIKQHPEDDERALSQNPHGTHAVQIRIIEWAEICLDPYQMDK